jgi:hypothetical protein
MIPSYIIIDLEFEKFKRLLKDTLTALRILWNKVEGQVMMKPKTRSWIWLKPMDV